MSRAVNRLGWGGGGGSPGLPLTSVQYNDGGAFAGDADFTFDKAANTVRLNGTLNVVLTNGYQINGAAIIDITGTENLLVGQLLNRNTSNQTFFFGNLIGSAVMSGADNIGIGHDVLTSLTTGYRNICIGQGAGRLFTTAYNNVCIGTNAGSSSTGSDNILIGYYAGANVGGANIILGVGAASNTAAIGNSVIIGTFTGENTTGTNTVQVGAYAGRYATGTQTIFIGYEAGHNPAGVNKTTTKYSLFIGYQAGRTAVSEKSVLIGYQAGSALAANGVLIIENSNDIVTPLIYGTFASTGTASLKINGRLLHPGIFAEIYDPPGGSVAQSIATGAAYTKLTAFTTDGQSSNCTPAAASDKITITIKGRYLVIGSFTITSGTAGVRWQGTVFLNAVEQTQIYFYSTLPTDTDMESVSFSGFIDVTAVPWDLDVRFKHDNVADINITVNCANLSVLYVGET